MAGKAVKLDEDIYAQVVEHTSKIGGKIAKFYDIAAKEKLERETKKPRNFRDYETKIR